MSAIAINHAPNRRPSTDWRPTSCRLPHYCGPLLFPSSTVEESVRLLLPGIDLDTAVNDSLVQARVGASRSRAGLSCASDASFYSP
jgi:hypothetical protein